MKRHTTKPDSEFSGALRRLKVRIKVTNLAGGSFTIKANCGSTDGEDSNGVSRASSVSAKDKPNGSKRKPKRRDDSESFESRSQFVAWPQHPGWGPSAPQYFPVNAAPFVGQFQQPYPNTPQPVYAPNQAFTPQMVPNNGFNPQYTGVPTVSVPFLDSTRRSSNLTRL